MIFPGKINEIIFETIIVTLQAPSINGFSDILFFELFIREKDLTGKEQVLQLLRVSTGT